MDYVGLYPVWYEPGIGSGWIVGLIATVHVLFSHTAVGAALFFAYLAHTAYRRDQPELLDFIKRYGLFLLVFSYVLGSITGPGIWYSTTVASPRGISALIHSFVWKWATEWVFFVIEVVGVYMIIYLVGKVDRATHLRISVIFGLASYGTMLIIIGILSFMMWPGKPEWFTEGGYLNGFYGANTFAQLALRTAFMFTMTAVVGGIVAGAIKDPAFKREITRKLALLGMASTVIGGLLFQWYMATLPETAEVIAQNRLPEWFSLSLVVALSVIFAWFAATWLRPGLLTPALASAMTLVVLVFGLWPEETARESLRKPYVAGQYVYSNQVIARDVPGLGIRSEIPLLERQGFQHSQVFVPQRLKTVTAENAAEVGHSLALTTCSNCHSLSDTGMRPLAGYFGGNRDVAEIQVYLQGALGTGNTLYMPHIPLNDAEAFALASFIAGMSRTSPLHPEPRRVAVNATAATPVTQSQE